MREKVDKSGSCVGVGCNSNMIVNRTYWLCVKHNHERIHGESIEDTARKQQLKYQEKYKQKQEVKGKIGFGGMLKIKQSTTKESKQKADLSKVKLKIRLEAIQNDTYYCKGCGKGGDLDCSHILSVRERKDLECDEENMNLFCRDCHNKWESNDIEQMLELLSFEKDLLYIMKHDTKKYNKILNKIEEYAKYFNQLIDQSSVVRTKLLRLKENFFYEKV